MKYWISLFVFIFSSHLLAAVPVTGSLQVTKNCAAYVSKNKKTNPDGLMILPNQQYEIKEINRPLNPDWLRIEVPGNWQYPERWVEANCGQANFVLQQQATCDKNPGMADAYIFALSWQPGFCQTYGYEAGKPECLQLASDSYQASHMVLHGLWPNQQECGQSYGFCGITPQNNHCDYPALAFDDQVAALMRVLMPSFAVGSCLERHEWYKHGSCQVLSSNDYFSLALRLTQEAQATSFGSYLHDHVGQRVPLAELREAIAQSFGEQAIYKVYLGCKNGYLVDIFIQLPALIPFTESLDSLVKKSKPLSRYDGCPALVGISNFSKKTFRLFDLNNYE